MKAAGPEFTNEEWVTEGAIKEGDELSNEDSGKNQGGGKITGATGCTECGISGVPEWPGNTKYTVNPRCCRKSGYTGDGLSQGGPCQFSRTYTSVVHFGACYSILLVAIVPIHPFEEGAVSPRSTSKASLPGAL